MVGIAATPDGAGYWEVASDGGIFTFGDAQFHGSEGGIALDKPVVGIEPTPDGAGYWEVASDGGIFTFGDASVLRLRRGDAARRSRGRLRLTRRPPRSDRLRPGRATMRTMVG